MHLPESPKLYSLNSDLALCMALRSHSKVPTVKGQHLEMTVLSSRTAPAWATTLSWGVKQILVIKGLLSGCTAPRINEQGVGHQAPRDPQISAGKSLPFLSRTFLSLRVAETKWNSHLYLPVIPRIVFSPQPLTSVDID